MGPAARQAGLAANEDTLLPVQLEDKESLFKANLQCSRRMSGGVSGGGGDPPAMSAPAPPDAPAVRPR